MKFAVFHKKSVWKISCYVVLRRVIDAHEELTVTNNTIAGVDNELLGASTRRGIESSTCVPRVLAAEVYGGGSEYFPFWQLPLWPSTLIRLFEQEEG